MAITKAKKTELVSLLDAKLKDAQSIVFVQFKGLNVFDTIAFRRALRTEGVGYTVIKKTLMKRVLGTKDITGTMPDLAGEVGVAYSNDLLASAREVQAFATAHKGTVTIVGGVFDGVYMNQSEMLAIANIPSREVLYTQLVGLLISPIRSFAVALDQIALHKEA